MDNLEKVAALGTQDTGRRQKKQKKTTQKIKKMSNTDTPHPPKQNRGRTLGCHRQNIILRS